MPINATVKQDLVEVS